MKFNVKDIYKDRVREIDKQLNMYVHQKKWDKVRQLRGERKSLMLKVQDMKEV